MKTFWPILIAVLVTGGLVVGATCLLVEMKKKPSKIQAIYTSDFGNISFELPEGYIVSESKICEGQCVKNLTISKLDNNVTYTDAGVSLQIIDNQKPVTFEEWFKNPEYTPTALIGTTNIGGVEARKYSNIGLGAEDDYKFIKGNFTYTISNLNAPENITITPDDQLTEKIVSTFRFL